MPGLITEYPSTRSTTLHLVNVIIQSMYTWIMYGIQTILQKTWEQQAYRKMSSTQSPASGRKVFSHTFSSIHYHQKCLLWTIVLLSPSPCLSHLSFFPSITFSLIQTMLLTLQGVFPQGEYGYPPSQLTKVVNLPSPPLLLSTPTLGRNPLSATRGRARYQVASGSWIILV